MFGLFRPSGGAVYHLRACRYRTLWQPFQAQVARWLETWNPSRVRPLLILGPSGGYTLATPWLREFDRVIAYDHDPLAPWFFRREHPGVQVEFHHDNLFWAAHHLTLAPMKKILKAHPDSNVLFANLLGQVLLEGRARESEWTHLLLELRQLLDGRSWASYHDILSFEGDQAIDHLTRGQWTRGLSRAELIWQLTPKTHHQVEAVHAKPT
ncbi:MAG: hypothetical protein AB7G93_10575 [Bdellovibrionales bacterium]